MERAESVCLTQPSAPALDGFSIAGVFFFFFFFFSYLRCVAMSGSGWNWKFDSQLVLIGPLQGMCWPSVWTSSASCVRTATCTLANASKARF